LVLLDDCADIRSLQIIGADCADLEPALDMPEHPHAAAIATSVQLYRSDPRICARVNAAIDSGSTEVVMWGDTDSVGPTPQMIAVTHHISQLAATFKTHALAAARARPSTDIAVEKFLAIRANLAAAGSTAADVEKIRVVHNRAVLGSATEMRKTRPPF
jgi:hypothetical protein